MLVFAPQFIDRWTCSGFADFISNGKVAVAYESLLREKN